MNLVRLPLSEAAAPQQLNASNA